MDFYDPGLMARDRVVLTDLQDVFGIDALESTLPISIEVTNPSYDMTYSRLSYGKGNCLLRMVENIITRDVFNTGINNYLFVNLYGNANRYDLWASLTTAAQANGTLNEDQDLAEIMEEWTSNPGYPIVNVHSNEEPNEITLVQQRFFSNPDASPSDSGSWNIPINFAYPGESEIPSTVPSLWLTTSDFSISTNVTTKPFIVNVQQTGYYRVNYGDDLWHMLTEVLTEDVDSIDPLNRAQMLDDSLNVARAGQLAYEVALGLSQYIANNEYHYIPVKAALNNFFYLDTMFREESDSSYAALKYYLEYIFGPLYDLYGFTAQDDEIYLDTLIREEMISWMCMYNYGDCVSQATSMFSSWMTESTPDDINPIPVDIKAPVYKTAIGFGSSAEWNFLWDRFLASTVDSERMRIIKALGRSEDEVIILEFLDRTIDATSGIRKQDASYTHGSIGFTATGRTVQFTWLEDNFDAIQNYHGTGFSNVVSPIVTAFAAGAKTQEESDRLQVFYNEHRGDIPGADNIFNPALESSNLNMKWMDNYFDIVHSWLVGHTPTTTTTTTTTTSNPIDTTTTTENSSDTTTTTTTPNGGDTTTTTTPNGGDTSTTTANVEDTTTSTIPTSSTSSSTGSGCKSIGVNSQIMLLILSSLCFLSHLLL